MAILIFLILLSVLILVHELGHFVAARTLGVTAEEFGLGFPPRIKALFRWKGTMFTLNWLPFGGFVRMKGEERGEDRDSAGAFYSQKIWRRALILVAGVFMNVVLAVVTFTVVYATLGIPHVGDHVTIDAVAVNSPAAAMLQPGDELVDYRTTEQFVQEINRHRGEEVSLSVRRPGESRTRTVTVTPRTPDQTPAEEGALGVTITTIEMIHYPWWQMPFRASVAGAKEAFGWGENILLGLGDMVARLVLRGQVPTDVAGPVGIAQLTGQIARQGWISVLQFVGILSMNLAVINILPIPALDGGRLLFLGIEKILGRPVDPRKERWAHMVGYVILISLIVLITIHDVRRLLAQ